MAKDEAKVVYVGRYQEGVDVLMPAGYSKHVPHGDALVTSEEHAQSLLTQEGEWQAAAAKPAAKEKE